MSERHLYAAIRYVERNPVRAKLAKKPWGWKWSSAQEYVHEKQSPIKLADISSFVEINNWREFLGEEEDENFLREIRKKTKTGRPLGNTTFVNKLEKILERKLHILPKGRPKEKRK